MVREEELLEAEAVEVAAPETAEDEVRAARPLPMPADAGLGLAPWRSEVRSAALAAAGGIVAGAATVAAVRATRSATPGRRAARTLRGRGRPANVVASRSFLVDVHLLGSK